MAVKGLSSFFLNYRYDWNEYHTLARIPNSQVPENSSNHLVLENDVQSRGKVTVQQNTVTGLRLLLA